MSERHFWRHRRGAPLDDGVAQAIMDHRFPLSIKFNGATLPAIRPARASDQSLETPRYELAVKPARRMTCSLKRSGRRCRVAARATTGPRVKLLWDVCRVRTFAGSVKANTPAFWATIFSTCTSAANCRRLDRTHIKRIDRTDGDIDTCPNVWPLSAHGPMSQRKGWTRDESHWRGETAL